MRKLMLLTPILLVACATAPAPIPVHGDTPGKTCQDANAQSFVGRQATQEVGSAILRATNAANLRWAAPGMMMTMDFRADRVTVSYGPDRVITKVRCG